MVPSAALAGLVAPMTSRFLRMAFSPSGPARQPAKAIICFDQLAEEGTILVDRVEAFAWARVMWIFLSATGRRPAALELGKDLADQIAADDVGLRMEKVRSSAIGSILEWVCWRCCLLAADCDGGKTGMVTRQMAAKCMTGPSVLGEYCRRLIRDVDATAKLGLAISAQYDDLQCGDLGTGRYGESTAIGTICMVHISAVAWVGMVTASVPPVTGPAWGASTDWQAPPSNVNCSWTSSPARVAEAAVNGCRSAAATAGPSAKAAVANRAKI